IKQTCDRRRVMPHARSQSCRLFPLMRLMIFVGPCLLAGVAHAQHAVAQQNGTTDRPQLPSTARIAPAGPIAIDGPCNEFSFTNAGSFAKGCAPADPAGLGCDPSSSGDSHFVGAPPWPFVAASDGGTLTVTE